MSRRERSKAAATYAMCRATSPDARAHRGQYAPRTIETKRGGDNVGIAVQDGEFGVATTLGHAVKHV